MLHCFRLALLTAASSLLFTAASCSKKEEPAPAPAPPAPTTGSIEGTVSPATAVATVTATSAGNVTFVQTPAASGAFAFAGLTPGSYGITCTPKAGFLAPAVRTVTVVAGQVAAAGTITVAAEPPGSIAGVIAPADAVTRVELVSGTGTVTPAVPNAATGAFSFDNLALGTYTVRFVTAPGYAAVPDQTNLQLSPSTTPLSLGTIAVQRSTIALTATLNGAQQVPANLSTATGTFVGTYTVATRSLTYRIEYTGLTPSVAHIHTGVPGTAGPVAIQFASLGSPITGTAILTPQQADDLLNNRMYVNIHTTGSPSGEIRGNIRR